MIEYKTILEVAEYLGVSRSTLDRWHQKGIGPKRYQHEIDHRVYYRADEVDDWLAQSRIKPAPQVIRPETVTTKATSKGTK